MEKYIKWGAVGALAVVVSDMAEEAEFTKKLTSDTSKKLVKYGAGAAVAALAYHFLKA
jgi:hypothetical protein